MKNNSADTHSENVNIKKALEKEHYQVDYYQREYAWGEKEVKELLDDLITKFRESYSSKDKPGEVRYYKQYFLGSMVLSNKNNNNYIIDGQQRLTTLTLLFAYIYKRGIESNLNIEDAKSYVYSNDLGELKFNLFVPDRIPVMEYIIGVEDEVSDEIKEHSLVTNYNIIKDYFEKTNTMDNDEFVVFYYWLYERVLLIKITTYDSEEAYTIFESMNDRGKPLTSLDMFKGYLLSILKTKRNDGMALWGQLTQKFKNDEELNAFLVNVIRARYVKELPYFHKERKSKNEWERVGSKYHRFIKEKRITNDVKIQNEEDVLRFLKEIIFYADYNTFINEKKKKLEKGYEGIFYLNKVSHPYLNTFFLGCVAPFDEEKEKKTKIMSKFLDIRSGILSWNLISLHSSSTTSQYVISLLNTIRNQKENDSLILIDVLKKEIERPRENNSWNPINESSAPTLNSNANRAKNIFYILSRVTSFIEEADGRGNNFAELYEKKYEIEHILAKDYLVNAGYFKDQDEIEYHRNKIGALGLLEKSINSSLQDQKYTVKKKKYEQHNRFLGLLSESLYCDNGSFLNHPGLNRMVKNNPQLEGAIRPYANFGKEEITERNSLIAEISKIIWNINDFQDFLDDDLDLSELSDFLDSNIDFYDTEEEHLDEYSFPIGGKLVFESGFFYSEFIYNGSGKITILKLENFKINENTKKRLSNPTMKKVYDEIVKSSVLGENNLYSWSGEMSNVTIKAPIYVFYGGMYSGSGHTVRKDYILAKDK